MSDESDLDPKGERPKRRSRRYPSNASSSSSDPRVTTSRGRVLRVAEDDEASDSSSGSSIGQTRKINRAPRVISDTDSDSSGSVIHQRRKTVRLLSSSDSESEEMSDAGFEGSSSQWETEMEEQRCVAKSTKTQDTGVESDSSDGQSEKCPICLLSFTNQEVGSPESCDHAFCVECIKVWSKTANTCPIDRQEYRLVLVRRTFSGKIYKQLEVEPPNQHNEFDNIVEDLTFCEICGSAEREDRMLLCDGCDLGFHLECLTPPLDQIPPGAWYCQECTPEDRLGNPEIELNELQWLWDDAEDLEQVPIRRRQLPSSPRLIPRTRQSERVRRQIATNRSNNQRRVDTPTTSAPAPPPPAPSSRRLSRRKKNKRRKPRYRTRYEIDTATGESIEVRTLVKRRCKKTKKRRRRIAPPTHQKTVKSRLARQLGMCAPGRVPQNLPDVKIPAQVANIHNQRMGAGIPTLHLFGTREELDLYPLSDEEENYAENGGGGVLVGRRPPNLSDVMALRRRARTKNIPAIPTVSSTSGDILDSILDCQSRFHSRHTQFSLEANGKLRMMKRVDLNAQNVDRSTRQNTNSATPNTRDSMPSSSGTATVGGSTSVTSNSNTYQQAPSSSSGAGVGGGVGQTAQPEDLSMSSSLRTNSNTEITRSNTPDSDVDIYSDIETVTTSKVDDDVKAPSPQPLLEQNPTNGSNDNEEDEDDDNMMVIDTEKAVTEENNVSSTVDSNIKVTQEEEEQEADDPVPLSGVVTSSTEIQSEAVQSTSNPLFYDNDSNRPREDEEEEEEDSDECPNFSIYSKESITLAKNTDIGLTSDKNDDKEEDNNMEDPTAITDQVGEISSTPHNPPEITPSNEPRKKESTGTGGLYSDSEDESVVKKILPSDGNNGNANNSAAAFGISDIRNMTEDISEEERSYTPCLDERVPMIDGLDTEMISDEERNDFDESHEMKTVSDGGDALEINAKESELDFTRPEDCEEGEIVDKLKKEVKEGSVTGVDSEAKKDEEGNTPQPLIKDDLKDECNKENESSTATSSVRESSFKKLSKSTKERNYREKDRDKVKGKEERSRSRSRPKKRKEIVHYNVRALIAKKPRPTTDEFGRELRSRSRSPSKSKSRSPKPSKRSTSGTTRRSSTSPRPRRKGRRNRSLSRSKSPPERRKSPPRTKSTKKRRRSSPVSNGSKDRDRTRKRRKSRDRSKDDRKKKKRSSRSFSPKAKEWANNATSAPVSRRRRRASREWTPSLSPSPPARPMTPSWTPPRMMDPGPVKPHNLTVILTNDNNVSTGKKKKDKRKKGEKRSGKEREKQKKRSRNNEAISSRATPPSKEVFASGSNILVSVSFNKDSETRDVSTAAAAAKNSGSAAKRKRVEEEKRSKKDKKKTNRVRKTTQRDLSGVKPVAIIDLDRSPFKELTPSPKDVIVLSDSDTEDPANKKQLACDSSSSLSHQQAVTSPPPDGHDDDPPPPAYLLSSSGPKTPPEPQVKFTLTGKPAQLRPISNPLHDPEEIERDDEEDEEDDDRSEDAQRTEDTSTSSQAHKGPNTPPDPPNSPPSSPDAYDPFEPTKSRSQTPETDGNNLSSKTGGDDAVDGGANCSAEKSIGGGGGPGNNAGVAAANNNSIDLTSHTPEYSKSHTPPLAEVQLADSQSSTTPDSGPLSGPGSGLGLGSVTKTTPPDRLLLNQNLLTASSKPVAQTIPFSAIATSMTSTPISSSMQLSLSRLNILNTTVLTSANVTQPQQRIVLPIPALVKSSPIKSSAVKPMPVKTSGGGTTAPGAGGGVAGGRKSSRVGVSNTSNNNNNNSNINVSGGANQNGSGGVGDGVAEANNLSLDSPYSPGSSDYEDLFDPPSETAAQVKAKSSSLSTTTTNSASASSKKSSPGKLQSTFDVLFGSPVNKNKNKGNDAKNKFGKKHHSGNASGKGTKQVGVKLDEDNLKILDDLPNSAVEMQVKDKFLKKLNRQERVVEEVKLVLKPHYNKKHVNKEEYKDILRRAVPKICHNKSGEINPTKIKNLVEAYVKKVRHSKKVTSSSSINAKS